MLRHLFKLTWNKKKTHALLIVEIWASFLVLFGLASLIIFNARNYLEPLGFAYERVWAINLQNNQDTTDVAEKIQQVVRHLGTYAEVESVTRMGSNFPFAASQMSNGVKYNGTHSMMNFYTVDENFARTLDITPLAGRWYQSADSVGKHRPAVINQKAREKLFGEENPLGKILNNDGENTWKVVGVIGNYKDKAEFMENKPAMFELLYADDRWNSTLLIKTKPGTDALFEARLVKDVTAQLKGWSVEVDHLTESRTNQHNLTLIPVLIFLIICSFLLVNVALGLFGILNLNIAKRKDEIGLRRAMGATERAVKQQFLGEIWVLATLSMLLGLLFTVQFPLLHVFDVASGVYLLAMVASVVIIYLLVTLCAWYPSRQAARIQPAVALHEE
ncbi:ABC transporter permease [Rhabdobacter roseus]|uniref:Putative ABC transport system permease protein n=1 Tax=Rhabdobacter roseus TaxID=1655419 RepID=A0A840TX06_9BACT|nr:FtsX-like permease family protein [Rhabdobacter roseus]MBB5287465.1 putative ABC transport system permease protein [Rhabdobacter roseus]